jgi:hypothetical protein
MPPIEELSYDFDPSDSWGLVIEDGLGMAAGFGAVCACARDGGVVLPSRAYAGGVGGIASLTWASRAPRHCHRH